MIRPAITPTESPMFIPAAQWIDARKVTPRRARCWHPWRAQHSHGGVTRWRCRGCCGCGEAS